jgi:hypothetical protein
VTFPSCDSQRFVACQRSWDAHHKSIADFSTYLLQCVEACDGAINLTSSMICNDNTITTNFDGMPSVCNALDSFDEEWLASRDPLPLFDEPFGLVPSVRTPMPGCFSAHKHDEESDMTPLNVPYILIHPLLSCVLWTSLRIDPSLFQAFQETKRNGRNG